MKRFFLSASVICLGLLTGCSSSNNSTDNAGQPNNGNGNGNNGNGNSSGTAGSGSGSGGSSSNSSGGSNSSGTGGSGDVTGGGGDMPSSGLCSTDANLVKSDGCWVGCDPTDSTDNPLGLQGAFYMYGDGSSCTVANPPCSDKGICMSGMTAVDPTYAKFGCGIGLELNSTGGTTSVKNAYTGPAKCFNYTLSGSSGGNEVRISFTQSADTAGKVSPYVTIPSITDEKKGTVCVGDVSCQGNTTKCSLTGSVFDLQIGIAGGNRAAAYNLCLTSLVPVDSGMSTLSQICGKLGATDSTEDVGKYFVQNNVNNDPNGSLCVTPGLKSDAASFTIDSSSLHDSGNAPAAYPSIVDGWHYGRVSSDSKLPKQVSALTTVTSQVNFTGSNGKYNASYDIWVLPSNDVKAKTPDGGLEVMVWLNYAGVNPLGSQVGNYNGYDVWVGSVNGWKYVAYVKQGPTMLPTDLAPFIKDAVSRTNMPATSYLMGIEFGFELWQNASGFKVNSFTSTVN